MNYVVGLAFNENFSEIILIHKNKGPKSVIGNWNGPGGKVEEKESFFDAMQREFKEETGLLIEDWILFCVITSYNHDLTIKFYYSNSDITHAKTMESETVYKFNVNDLPSNVMHNLKWLIPLCNDPYIQLPLSVFYD